MPKSVNTQGTDGGSVTEVLPRYELVSPSGWVMGSYPTAQEAASAAGGFWPGIGQDEDRTGKGWDVQVVGS